MPAFQSSPPCPCRFVGLERLAFNARATSYPARTGYNNNLTAWLKLGRGARAGLSAGFSKTGIVTIPGLLPPGHAGSLLPYAAMLCSDSSLAVMGSQPTGFGLSAVPDPRTNPSRHIVGISDLHGLEPPRAGRRTGAASCLRHPRNPVGRGSSTSSVLSSAPRLSTALPPRCKITIERLRRSETRPAQRIPNGPFHDHASHRRHRLSHRCPH